jgi:hypothetical protein
MRRSVGLLVASFVAFATLAASPAGAQSPPAPPPNQTGSSSSPTDARALAEMLFFTGRGLMEAGRYPEACAKLGESYRLDAASGTLLNLAVCNEKIGKIASAWGEYRDALAEARRMNRPDREALASDHIKVIEPDLPFLTITVPPHVRAIRGLEIMRNGIPIQGAGWDTELPVDPGDVEIVERAPLYKPKTLHVTVGKKEHGTITVEPLEIAPIERPPVPFWTARRSAGFIMLAGGVAAAVGGTLFGLQAIHQKQESDNNCQTYFNQLRCNSSGVSEMSNAKTAAWLSDGLFGLAIAGVGVGSYFFFTTSSGQERATPTMAKGDWTWNVSGGPKGATGWLTRSF